MVFTCAGCESAEFVTSYGWAVVTDGLFNAIANGCLCGDSCDSGTN